MTCNLKILNVGILQFLNNQSTNKNFWDGNYIENYNENNIGSRLKLQYIVDSRIIFRVVSYIVFYIVSYIKFFKRAVNYSIV